MIGMSLVAIGHARLPFLAWFWKGRSREIEWVAIAASAWDLPPPAPVRHGNPEAGKD
jgi:hypothetical protein